MPTAGQRCQVIVDGRSYEALLQEVRTESGPFQMNYESRMVGFSTGHIETTITMVLVDAGSPVKAAPPPPRKPKTKTRFDMIREDS